VTPSPSDGEARLLIVSNRLPVTVTCTGGQMEVQRSAGGLATGLRGPHERSGGLWIGWPGDTHALDEEQRAALARRLDELRAVPVDLTPDEVAGFYEGFSNGVLWPLFHYLPDQVPLHVENWDAYERVNERFADVVAAHHQPGDLVWVHDYQLMLVPQLVRERLPDARVAFFLHIPFPASEIFRTLPFRERLLEGLLGADLVGFHTAAYMRHFASSLLRILGVASDVDRVRWATREIRLGVFPMGIDPDAIASLAETPQNRRTGPFDPGRRRMRRAGRHRSPRLHQGNSAASPRLREAAPEPPILARARAAHPGCRPLADQRRSVCRVPPAGRGARRPSQR
jgi:trehalose 6-phosphate synthase/phosphatase